MIDKDYWRTVKLNAFSVCPKCSEDESHLLSSEEGSTLLCGTCGNVYERQDSSNLTIAVAGPVCSLEDIPAASEVISRLRESATDS